MTNKTSQLEQTGIKHTDYDAVTPLEWAEYEFATIAYDYQIHQKAAIAIREIFKRLSQTPLKPRKRYYCRNYEATGQDHCDDRRNTIQCEYCIWKEQEEKQRRS